MSYHINKYRHLIIFILFLGLFFVLGVSYERNNPRTELNHTQNLEVINSTNTSELIDMTPFWEVWGLLDEKYVVTKNESIKTTKQDLIWGAVKGMTDALGDPYTVFLPPEESKEFKDDISGNFEGVGMEIGIKDGVLSVISPLKGSPAESSGIKAGDKIITIDGVPASDLSTDNAVKLIRGTKGTVVKIGVLRNTDNKPYNFEITRAIISLPTVKTEIKGDVFVISLYNFYAGSKKQFQTALKEFVNSKKQKLVLDLRGNPGGFLDAAVDMASWFLPLGKVIVREDFGNNLEENVYRSIGYNIFNDKLKFVILVDTGSASASEILAGALQEYGVAKLVGTNTYGKGSVQQLLPVTGESSLKVTVAKWLTPGGKSISDGGLTPDYLVKITAEDYEAGRDLQMEKAIEILEN